MIDTADQDAPLSPRRADAMLCRCKQLVGILGRVIGQDVTLEVGPTVLDRVQLWGVSGKVLQTQPAACAFDKLPNLGRSVRVQAVPHDNDRASDITQQLSQEFAALRRIDVLLGVEAEESLRFGLIAAPGPRADSPDHGDLRVRAADLPENWRLACGSPRTSGERRHENPTLVDERDRGTRQLGFFLMRAQVRRRQPRIFASFRSMARRSGFCGLQPNFRNNLGMWEMLYFTPNSR